MIFSVKIIVILSFSYIVVETRRLRVKEDETKPTRDYRPSKWIPNSALDVWYGNKSMVDILTREFTEVVNRIALRPVRSNGVNNKICRNLTAINHETIEQHNITSPVSKLLK